MWQEKNAGDLNHAKKKNIKKLADWLRVILGRMIDRILFSISCQYFHSNHG